MQCHSLGFTTDTSILESGGSEIRRRDTYWAIQTPHNPNFYWGNFLLVDDQNSTTSASDWLNVFAHEFPHAAHFALGLDSPQRSEALSRAFLEAGFEVDEMAVMTCSPSALGHGSADGGETRLVESDEDWEAVLEVGVATRGPGFAEDAYRDYYRSKVRTQRQLVEAGKGAWWGTFIDGTLASSAGIIRCDGSVARYQTVGTHPEFERRGFASATVAAAGHWASEVFASTTLVIVADPAYHAMGLYEKLGFRVRETQTLIQGRPARDRSES